MSLVRNTVANFIGGVSQQTDKLMYPNQSKDLVNHLLDPIEGLKRRPPTEFISKLFNTPLGLKPYVHTIFKEDEAYQVFLTGNDIKVFDLKGNAQIVNYSDSNESETKTNPIISQTTLTRSFKRKVLHYATTTLADDWYELKTANDAHIGFINEDDVETGGDIYDIPFSGGTVIGSWTYTANQTNSFDDGVCQYIDYDLSFTKLVLSTGYNEQTTLYTVYPAGVGYSLYIDESMTMAVGLISSISSTSITRVVSTPLAYITTASPSTDLFAVTIADYTFILNKTVTTALKNDTVTNTYNNSALIFVKQADYATEYKVTINGTTTATYTTPNSTSTNCTTSYIASQLASSLSTALGTGWTITREGSVILLQGSSAFTIVTSDGNGNRNLFSFYNETSALEDLPIIAPKGFILKIVGDDASVYDDYYVRFETSDGSTFGSGTWQECPAPNIKYKINADTMPHVLIREANGTFTYKKADWTERKAGDEDTAPTPSFIGNKIQEVLTYKSRLGFVAGDRSCYSDTQDIFSFFKRTTQTELDTDPIDVGSNSKMVLLKHSLPFNESLLLFSEQAQFNLSGGDIFSNSTVSINLATEYQCSKNCKPITVGSRGFFVFENGAYSRLMATYITPSYNIDANDVTEQVPSYIPSGVYKLAGSAANNILLCLTKDEEDAVYIYNSYYSGEKLVQSSWHKWKFKDAKILNVDIDKHLIYITNQYEDGVYLEKLNLSPKLTEDNLDFLFYLDHKIYHSNLVYNGTTHKTTIALPYTPSSSNNLRVLDTKGFPIEFTLVDNVITVEGEYTELITGEVFESYWKLPVVYVREQTQNGGMKVKEGILMLRDINLAYADTGHFKVSVTPKYSTQIASVFEFTGKICGMSSSTLGKIPISSGTFLIPVISKSDEIEIEINNDGYLPSCFLSLEWLGEFVYRGM